MRMLWVFGVVEILAGPLGSFVVLHAFNEMLASRVDDQHGRLALAAEQEFNLVESIGNLVNRPSTHDPAKGSLVFGLNPTFVTPGAK
jgi:hypothetical protein